MQFLQLLYLTIRYACHLNKFNDFWKQWNVAMNIKASLKVLSVKIQVFFCDQILRVINSGHWIAKICTNYQTLKLWIRQFLGLFLLTKWFHVKFSGQKISNFHTEDWGSLNKHFAKVITNLPIFEWNAILGSLYIIIVGSVHYVL